VRVICASKGCEIGSVVETDLGPVWKPKDAQFDPSLAGDDPYRLRGSGNDTEVVIIRREPIRPVPLDNVELVKELAETARVVCVVGACVHGIHYAPIDDVMDERRNAVCNQVAGKLTATPQPG
jgi:hypothetical protein